MKQPNRITILLLFVVVACVILGAANPGPKADLFLKLSVLAVFVSEGASGFVAYRNNQKVRGILTIVAAIVVGLMVAFAK